MEENKHKNLLKHYFWGNFDSGVIFIFLSLMIWDETENMLTVALAFSIPIVIDTAIDYLFSIYSDQHNRKRLFIIGNIGSAIALSFYGYAQSVYILYFLIFLKSLFAKLYQSSIDPYIRENIREEFYMDFLSQRNIRISIGASIGGFALMVLYGFTLNLPLIFIASGLIELYSTLYLFNLDDEIIHREKEKEDLIDLNWIRNISVIYTIESFGTALIINRMLIYIHEFQGVAMENVGLIFFIVYGISNMIAAKVYKKFDKFTLNTLLITSFLFQAFLLIFFITFSSLNIVIIVWFIFELLANITNIYVSNQINSSLFTNIGRRLSKFRIMIAVGNILGQLIVSQIWDQFGMNMSFYFSGVVLIILSIFILSHHNKYLEK